MTVLECEAKVRSDWNRLFEMETEERFGAAVEVLTEGGIRPRLEPTILREARPLDSFG